MEHEDLDGSMTVTIALDSPEIEANQSQPGYSIDAVEEEIANFFLIPPPPTAAELMPKFRSISTLLLREIPKNLANLLELRLNSPICGSMANWEFLAAHLGMSHFEILALRRNESPTGVLFFNFGDEHFIKLLELIGQAGRVDVLLSLLPFTDLLSNVPKNKTNNLQRPQQKNVAAVCSTQQDSGLSLELSRLSAAGSNNNSPPLDEPFILLLHHERPANRNLRRLHRMLLVNLEKYAAENELKVLDVDQCFCSEDLLGSIHRYFAWATQILLALSADYAETIAAPNNENCSELDQRGQLKRSLHQMTFQEVLYNRGENRRFRVIIMRGTEPKHVPRGWPSNTLHYRFPDDFSELCFRIFDAEKNNAVEKGRRGGTGDSRTL